MERVQIRRLLGYSVIGTVSATGGAMFDSWRFMQAPGVLEYRLTNIAPNECAMVRMFTATWLYLDNLRLAANDGLDVGTAAIYIRNKQEMTERTLQMDLIRQELASVLAVPLAGFAGKNDFATM